MKRIVPRDHTKVDELCKFCKEPLDDFIVEITELRMVFCVNCRRCVINDCTCQFTQMALDVI